MIIPKTKRAFEVKQKTIFLVSQVLSFRHKKQTSKKVADTTFKLLYFFLNKICSTCNDGNWFVSVSAEITLIHHCSSNLIYQILQYTPFTWNLNRTKQNGSIGECSRKVKLSISPKFELNNISLILSEIFLEVLLLFIMKAIQSCKKFLTSKWKWSWN